MTSTDFGDTAREWARRLEDREETRSECPISAARAADAALVAAREALTEARR